jgi:putative hydroxymethylpyrimidine transport system substrate-binding protein
MKGFGVVGVTVAAALLVGCGQQGGSETARAGYAQGQAGHHDKPMPRAARKHPEVHKKLQHLTLTLDGHEGPTAAAIIMADRRGYFAEAGLAVDIYDPATPNRPVRYVADGADDLGVSHEPEVALAQERGAPIIAVGSLVPRPTAAMIWAKGSRIHGIRDLKGKTIAIPGLPFQEGFLRSVLRRAGLTLEDVRLKRVGYNLVPVLAYGRADAIFGGSWNIEAIELEQREVKPVITPVGRLGIPPYDELVVIARTDRVAKDPELIRDFMSAVARGAAAAVDDPAGTVEAIERADEGNPEATFGMTEAETEATLPLLSRSGRVSPGQARVLGDWMHEQGMLQRKPPVSAP